MDECVEIIADRDVLLILEVMELQSINDELKPL